RDIAEAHRIRRIRLESTECRLRKAAVFFIAIQYGMRVWVVRVVHFVANAPRKDGEVVAVAFHHVGQILFTPFLEIFIAALESGRTYVPPLQPLPLGK